MALISEIEEEFVEIELDEFPLVDIEAKSTLRELMMSYVIETGHTSLNAILNATERHTDEVLKEAFLVELSKNIKGSLTQALTINTVAFFSTFMMMVAANPAMARMVNLSDPLKMGLSGATSITGALFMIPIGKRLDETGGKTELLMIRGVSVLGGVGLIFYSTQIDFSTMHSFDLRYATLFSLFSMMGACLPTFLLSTNLLYWAPIKDTGFILSLYAGIGGSALGASQLLLQAVLKDVSLPIVYTVLTSVLLAGGLAFAKFYALSPYHQLKELKLNDTSAKEIAILLQQERFPLKLETSYAQSLLTTLGDFRTFALTVAFFNTVGTTFSSIVRMQMILTKKFQLSTATAAIITGTGSLCVPVGRLLVGKPMDKWDASGGAYTFLIGSMLILGSSLAMAIFRDNISLAPTLVAKYTTDIGIGAAAVAISRLSASWAAPTNPDVSPYNIGLMAGITSAFGQASGLVLPAIIAMIVYGNETEGYYDSFYLTAGIALVASILVSLTHYHNQQSLTRPITNAWCRLFQEYKENRSIAIDPSLRGELFSTRQSSL